jgi:hypothetical protein
MLTKINLFPVCLFLQYLLNKVFLLNFLINFFKASFTEDNFENEPPLLEELGINFEHIRLKTLAVLNPLGTAKEEVLNFLKLILLKYIYLF